jgi:hypothetical protein
MTRHCGSCQLCCTLLPVRELAKGANTRCEHQRFGKGCGVYGRHPLPCKLWSCVWLTTPGETRDMRRPDRAHYCVDPLPEFITRKFDDGRERKDEVVQVWCDPRHPEAHRDPALRVYLERRGLPAIIRFDSQRGLVIVPPQLTDTGEWFELESTVSEGEHTAEEIARVVGGVVVHLGPEQAA